MAEILEEISLTRVKLLCSYAGRILSRPSDGKLRYVGGETRIIAVNRDITYSELMLRIVELHGQTVALKYQLPDEDLDALVSLCSDEDIENMMDEYAAEGGNSRIRVFLFNSSEHDVEHLSESSGDMRHSNRSILDGGVDLGAVKRSESGASDKMRDLDDMIGLYSDDTQSASVFEDTAPPPSAPQLLDGVSLLEQFLQLSSAAPLSQSVQIGSSDSSVFTSKTLSMQTAAVIFPKEHVGAANCVQFPAHSVSNTTHLASSFSESATLGSSKLSDCENSSDVLTSMTEDHLVQHSASATAAKLLNKVHSNLLSSHKFDGMQITKSLGRMNQRETLAAEQGLLVNLEAYDFTLSNLSKVYISNENASAQPELCLQSHTVEPLQNLESYGIVGYKDLEIEHQNALNSYESLPISKSSDEVVAPEGFESSCNDITDGAGLDSDQQFYNFRKTNVVGEAQVAAENFLCGGASSDKLLDISGNESLKEQDTKTTDVQLKDPILNELSSRASVQRHPSEHVQKTTTIASQMSPLSTTQNVVVFESMHTETTSRMCILQPEMCFSSSLAAEILDLSASLLKNSSDAANKVNTGCFEGNGSQELITDGETVAMSELQQFCETSAPEQIRGRGDIEQQLNAFVNEYVQEEVLLQDNAVNIEVTNDVILEVSTCTSMDIKPDLKPSTFTTVASEAEVEAIARGLQIIRNTDLEERRELGSGTFGTVYHGKWRGSDVAIKRFKSSCFSGSLSEQERLKADFWKEACILAQLHHPNIVAFYGVVPDGTLATVTEFMINGSLKQVLRKKSDRILDSRRRLFIAMDSAFGMEYLHSKKIVHFDLKCENLFVNMRDPHRPVCKVGDFGLSKVKQRTLVSGGVRGTLPWMAPELLNGSSNMVSEKVDVFSFGIVMWELLTSEEPYADLHYGAILGGILSDTLRPPVPEGCEPAWRLLMERCWSADPVQRPTFAEIASALRLMAASELVKVQRSNQVTEVAAQEDAS